MTTTEPELDFTHGQKKISAKLSLLGFRKVERRWGPKTGDDNPLIWISYSMEFLKYPGDLESNFMTVYLNLDPGYRDRCTLFNIDATAEICREVFEGDRNLRTNDYETANYRIFKILEKYGNVEQNYE